MKKTGEWGQFFPMSISPFGYNETIANEYHSLTKDQALAMGAKWHDEDTTNRYKGPKIAIPDHIADIKDEITKQILYCETCEKNYKIIPKELDFYKKIKIPPPRSCPDCRHKARLELKTPRHLYPRACAKCATPIQTTYAQGRPEKVYCEKCYLKEVY